MSANIVMMNKLQIQNIVKCYNKREVVKKVSFEVNSGEVIGLLGPNGAGKTTSFYTVVGLIKPNSGAVMLNGQDITHLAMHKRAAKGIGYLPQERSIFRKMTVSENILSILELRKDLKRSDRKTALSRLLSDFSIEHIKDTAAISLSGGECRRVEIARCLAINPQFILLDEPFAGIDPVTISEIKELIRSLTTKGIGILITDHNVRETLSLCDRSYIINAGTVIAEGPSHEIIKNKEVQSVYLGEEFTIE